MRWRNTPPWVWLLTPALVFVLAMAVFPLAYSFLLSLREGIYQGRFLQSMICKQGVKHIAIGPGIEIACYDGITIGAQRKNFLANQHGCFPSRLPPLMVKVSVQKEDRFALCVLKVSQFNPSCDARQSRVPPLATDRVWSFAQPEMASG